MICGLGPMPDAALEAELEREEAVGEWDIEERLERRKRTAVPRTNGEPKPKPGESQRLKRLRPRNWP